ncbi:hypothetical protein Tco_0505574 [Tanacetum coccineum]
MRDHQITIRFLTNTNILLLYLIERRDEKKRLDHLKQDQTMLVIKRFSEKKKVFRERKKTGKIHAKRVCPIVNAPAGRLLGAYDLGVATPRALVHAGDKTSGDARSWYMISGDVKSWVVIVLHIFTVI